MGKAITTEISGIKCDDAACDYRDDTAIFEPEKYLNMPCPKCGANLFTQADYDTMKKMLAEYDAINEMVGDIDLNEDEIIHTEIVMDGSGVPDIIIKGRK